MNELCEYQNTRYNDKNYGNERSGFINHMEFPE